MNEKTERLPPEQAMKEAAAALDIAIKEQDPAKHKEILSLIAKLIGDGLDMSQADLEKFKGNVRQVQGDVPPAEPKPSERAKP